MIGNLLIHIYRAELFIEMPWGVEFGWFIVSELIKYVKYDLCGGLFDLNCHCVLPGILIYFCGKKTRKRSLDLWIFGELVD